MNHDLAVQTIVSLAPSIEKKGAARALSDYAEAEDLPPAQLEKLGQVYNTLRTISHIDNAEQGERGATVPLLNIPEMVVGYATGWDREKAAAPVLSFQSHDPNTVDLAALLDAEVAGMSKAAAAEVEVPAEAAAGAVKMAVDADLQADALLDVEIDLDDRMAKLAGHIIGAAPRDELAPHLRDVSAFEEDALRLQPAAGVKMAGEYLERYAGALHIKLARFDHASPVAPYAFDVPDGPGRKFAELAEVAGQRDIIVKLAAGDPDTWEKLATLRTADPGGSPDAFTLAPPLNVDAADPAAPANPNAAAAPSADEAREKAEQKGLVDGGGGPGAPGSPPPPPPPPSTSEGKEDKEDKGGKGDDKKSDRKSTDKGGPGVVGRTLGAAGSALRGTAGKAEELLARITAKERQNKPQRALDMDIADIRRSIGVRRLIASDPILKEQDPREILEIYNSIAQKFPDLAGDMASLRLLLREAVNYEGLPLDAQKMLTEVRRNAEQGDAAAEENARRRYAVGGGPALTVSLPNK